MCKIGLTVVLVMFGCGDDTGNTTPDLAVADLAATKDFASPAVCDPVAQTGCNDPSKPKCALVPGPGMSFVPACVAAGTVAEGQPCTTTSPGIDNCLAGGCAPLGQPNGQPVCRRICTADGNCSMSQKCVTVGGGIGICAPTCSAFGTTCPGQTTCHEFVNDIGTTQLPLLLCASVGTVNDGEPCPMGDSQCGADSVCNPSLHCAQLCDGTHACAALGDGGTALTCTSVGGGVSLCQ